MSIISSLLVDSTFEFFCLVDSIENVNQLGKYFKETEQCLNVLLEVGMNGARTGVRDESQRDAVLTAIRQWPDNLMLAGVEVFEGVLSEEQSVRTLLQRVAEWTVKLVDNKDIRYRPAILTGAGSAWYDIVAEEFDKVVGNRTDVEIVLRPGCYLSHDAGTYKTAQEKILQRNPIAKQIGQGLRPALHIWAYVQSIPESNRAIISMGKRDVAFDAGYPMPSLHYRSGWAEPRKMEDNIWEVTGLMDQHAFMRIREGDDLRVGDMIAFNISHPCLTFDKWKYILIVDTNFTVIDIAETYF
ncbi:unnamed protein product [Didymodactylos carnosus]|uniref:D-serine dehydratase-like domain-containing protein n=1 Tax=Didymodactylos carnosus TaxID=1234261 RepID=A0A8S2DYK7_9BILA|nr:unnamed protein product [Didymodactylos carnosus]CAF3785443.1 unnamed protein product [Didymodactylos carnosus]